jgi:hypothetical protein
MAVGFRKSVTDASNTMTDSDFFGDRQVFFAESVPEMDLILASADVAYRLKEGEGSIIKLLFHVEYERVNQYVVGFEGWQGSLFSDFRTEISETRPALDYEITYVSPQVGGAVASRLGRNFQIGFQGSLGLLFASDRDNHLLRERIAEGDGFGVGLHSRAELGLDLGLLGLRRISLTLKGDLRYYYAEGRVDQRWYDGTNREILGLPYQMDSLQTTVGLAAVMTF